MQTRHQQPLRLRDIDLNAPQTYRPLLSQEGLSQSRTALMQKARRFFAENIPEETLGQIVDFLRKQDALDAPEAQRAPIEAALKQYAKNGNERMPGRSLLLEAARQLGLEHDLPRRVKDNIRLWQTLAPLVQAPVYFSRKPATVGCDDAAHARARIPALGGAAPEEVKSLYRLVRAKAPKLQPGIPTEVLVLFDMDREQRLPPGIKKAFLKPLLGDDSLYQFLF